MEALGRTWKSTVRWGERLDGVAVSGIVQWQENLGRRKGNG
jgi:hypothetical protein